MRTLQVIGLLMLGGVVGLAVLYWQNLSDGEVGVAAPSPLAQAINQCDLIAGKAAAALPEALPFQRLEKAARQSRVLDRCMQDQGYQENPDWVRLARAKAGKAATAEVSASEAYEALRRQAMLQPAPAAAPAYWRKRV